MVDIKKTDVYARWLDDLRDIRARARVLARVERLAAGNPGDVKSVGEGVSEMRIDYGQGFGCILRNAATKSSFCWPVAIKALRIPILKPPKVLPVTSRITR
jgi:putative addiction module killer protein